MNSATFRKSSRIEHSEADRQNNSQSAASGSRETTGSRNFCGLFGVYHLRAGPAGKTVDRASRCALHYTNALPADRHADATDGASSHTGEHRMIRLPLATALAAGLLWVASGSIRAQDARPVVSPQAEKINELIGKGWETAGIKKPALRATDHEFMRRAFIDLIGRIPTPEEIADFDLDRSANRRARLVYRLLNETNYKPKDSNGRPLKAIKGLKMPKEGIDYNDAYAQNFAELWTTWLLTRSNTLPLYREQLHLWLTQQFVNSKENPTGTPWNKIVNDLISATGKGNANGAVIFVIRHLGDQIVAEAGQKIDFVKEGKYDAVPITSRVTKLFLGIQSQCVQCHDHPFHKEYVQSDFWGVNAFFRQADRSGTTNPRNLGNGVTPPQLMLSDMPDWNQNGMVLYERRDGQRKASFPVICVT